MSWAYQPLLPAAAQLLAAVAAGRVKVWNGSAFVAKPVKVWTGSAWVEKTAKFWSGSTWA